MINIYNDLDYKLQEEVIMSSKHKKQDHNSIIKESPFMKQEESSLSQNMTNKMYSNENISRFTNEYASTSTVKEIDPQDISRDKSNRDILDKHKSHQTHLEPAKKSSETKNISGKCGEDRLTTQFKEERTESRSLKDEERDQHESQNLIGAVPQSDQEKRNDIQHVIPEVCHVTVYARDIIEKDVLCGKGAGTNRHPGNQFFRKLVNTYQGLYSSVTMLEKAHIASTIVNTIMRGFGPSGRFLRKLDRTSTGNDDKDLWYEIGYEAAKEKTSQALREKYLNVHIIEKHIPGNIYLQPLTEQTSRLVKHEGTAESFLKLIIQPENDDPLSYQRHRENDANNERGEAFPLFKTTTKELSADEPQQLQMDKSKPIVKNVNGNDVLMGRGGVTNSHIGNIRFRKLVHDFQLKYLNLPKMKKSSIAKAIVEIIHHRDGRFLMRQREKSRWEEVDDNRARGKTSQALREKAPEIRKSMFYAMNNISSNMNRYDTNINNNLNGFLPAPIYNFSPNNNAMNLQTFQNSAYSMNTMMNKRHHSNVSRQHDYDDRHTTAIRQQYFHSSKKRRCTMNSNISDFSSCSQQINVHDVLYGRGAGVNNHPGNIHFRNLVRDHKKSYVVSTKIDKGKIAMNIVYRVHSLGGRFLTMSNRQKNKNTTCQWTVVHYKKAREKVSQALREKYSTGDNGTGRSTCRETKIVLA